MRIAHHSFLRKQMACLGVLIMSLGLAACGGTSSNKLPSVTIGYENAPDPEMVAIEQHLFRQYMHANVTLKYYSNGPAALTSLASGDLQFMTVLGNPPIATAIAHGVPLQVIWAQEQYETAEGLVVRPSITSLKQLEGKTVVLVTGSTSPFALTALMKKDGIPAGSIKFENLSPADMVSAWDTNRIQAAYVWVPFFSEMLAHGGHALAYDEDASPEAPIFNLAVVNSTWAKTHSTLVQGFIKAEAAAYNAYTSDPTTAYQDMAAVNGISAAEAKSQASGLRFISLQGQVASTGLGTPSTVSTSLVTQSLSAAAKYLYSIESIPSVPTNMAQYVNPSYVEDVIHSGFAG